MFKALAALALLLPASWGQTSFEAAEIQPAGNNSWSSVGILPDGHIRCRNATLRMLIAAAYGLDADRVTGGPGWLDADRFDVVARTAPAASADLRRMVQALLAEDFKLAVHHTSTSEPVYMLTVGQDGAKLPPAAGGDKGCRGVPGPPSQIHLACHSLSMADLADFLPQAAGGYLRLPVEDGTGLNGAYDFPLDWMGRGPYDSAQANQAAGAPKDPLAISIFEALGKLGLVLEKRDLSKDGIVVDKAERLAAKVATGTVAPPPAVKPEQEAAIDRYVSAEMEREHIPGLAVGVYSRGDILLARGYGLANVELNVPVKPETIFQSGSVGKQFAAAGVMMLVEEGKVGLDDSIVKYFPNAPESWKPIRVKNLLSHTSGLAEYESGDRVGPKGAFYLRLDFTEDELVNKIEALPIEFQAGEKWNYRNTNYVLLGVLIHRVTGKFYADFLQERIYRPWGMGATRLISESDIIPNRSSGYEMRGGKLRNQEWVSPTFNSTADGTLYFNVLDLAKWDEALYGTSLLKQSSLDRIWTVFPLHDGSPNAAHYGFGWEMTAVNGHRLIEHGGAWQGFTCDISRYVDDGLTVVVLTNLAGARPGVIAHTVAAIANPALAPAPPKQHQEITLDPKVLDGYTGKYELAPEVVMTITRQGDHLFAQLTGQGMVAIYAESQKDFFLKVVDAQITFATDGQGRATELILHQNGDKPAKRIE